MNNEVEIDMFDRKQTDIGYTRMQWFAKLLISYLEQHNIHTAQGPPASGDWRVCLESLRGLAFTNSHRLPKPSFVISPPAFDALSFVSSSGDRDRERSFSASSHPGEGF